MVGQQVPLRGSRIDFIQHFPFFYSKMTIIIHPELARVPICLHSSDPVHPEGRSPRLFAMSLT